MIFDTDVLIWFFRKNANARKIIEDTKNISISAITLMELIQGVRNKNELYLLNKFLTKKNVNLYYVNEKISIHAITLLEQHNLSEGVELGDTLIAATSIIYGEEILTANIKHYRKLPNIKLKKFNPN